MGDREHTLLLIDDSENQLKLLRILLSSIGYKVVTAGNGREGLAALEDNEVDLVLCDVQMPVMDGPSFLTELRSKEEESRTPVILLSAAGDDYKQEAFNLGADAVCGKDNVKENLFPLLKTLL